MPRTLHHTSALLFALICAATLLSGCAAPWPFPQPTPTTNPPLPDSQQIFRPQEIGLASGDLETLDPALIEYNSDYDLAQLIFPGLVTLDEQGQPVDWAAESHEVSADGLTYTFHLRKGMTWSDGTPIDASTFAYSINRALDPCTGSYTANYLYAIKGAQAFNAAQCPTETLHSSATLIGSSLLVPDPLTLHISLQQPAGYFLAALTWPLSWAVPQALIEKYPGSRYLNGWTDHLADNGGFGGNLFKLAVWTHPFPVGTTDPANLPPTYGKDGHAHLAFERNERFWGKKPLLRRIESTLYKSTYAAWTDFTTSKNDTSQPPLDYLTGSSRWKDTVIQQTQQLSLSWLAPNWHMAPFDDLRVRQAFSLALDRQAIAKAASSATSFSSLTFKDLRFPSIHLIPDSMPGYNPGLADAAGRKGKDALTADLVTARQLAAAYAAAKCDNSYAKCTPIIWLSRGYSTTQTMMMINQWQAAFPGWRIFDDPSCHTQICQYQYIQLSSGGWLADYPDPQDFLSLSWSTHAAYNRGYASVPAVDALCAQADASSDQALRISLYQQAEQLLVNQGAAIPLYQSTATYVVRSRVVGWRMAPAGQTPLSVWQQVYIRR
jgi:peptide/nickel transport system substrate-binding protein/oligopeptide transport system substrate-binding protein